ncbi:hypothetical protein T07_5946 [Trichinella nelsoni]|uniref:Uncharacterized protein n=1 Tax=Trichinella nelsoni TaxID=6336 RepID=A0A0V0RLB5_9BILA|nr:hypothetical protein T07_5946 [Trichinella nelsoni]
MYTMRPLICRVNLTPELCPSRQICSKIIRLKRRRKLEENHSTILFTSVFSCQAVQVVVEFLSLLFFV